MRILQINSVCGYGSTGKIVKDICEVAEKEGHQCLVAFGRDDAPKNMNTIKIGSFIDFIIHALKTRIFDLHGFASVSATKELIKKIEKFNPDIINLHNLHGYYINIDILFAYLKKINKPVIWTLHDCWAFTGHCAYFDYVGCDKWLNICTACPQKNCYPKSILFDGSKYNFCKKKELFNGLSNMTIIVPSIWLSNLVKRSFLKEYDVEIIYNGIDLDIFKPIKSSFKEEHDFQDKFVVLGVASVWDKRKGLSDFIELSKLLGKEYQIILVGLTNQQIAKLPSNIFGIKRTNDAEGLAKLYTAADIFVNPSLEETMGLVTVEALACGTPVIVYNATAIPEVVAENCGKIVERGNVEGLAKAIISCKKNNFKSVDCRKRAEQYNKEKQYKKYLSKYMDIVGVLK